MAFLTQKMPTMKFQSLIYTYLLIFLLISCGDHSRSTRFELLSPQETGINFNNKLQLTDSFNIMEFDYIYNGGGVAIGDFNNDNLADLFFTGNQVSCRLYLNRGNLRFEDVTTQSGVATSQWTEGVTLADINNDGFLDIYVSTSSGGTEQANANLLFINKGIDTLGIPSFTEKAAQYGINDSGYNTQAAFFDFDKDGHLDLYVLSNALENFNRNTTRPKKLDGSGNSTDKLYRNNGNGTFTDVSKDAGILIEGYGLGVVISDINNDSWPDIYVANDFVTNDILYINNGNGTFSNHIKEQMKHQSHNAMGVDAADFNNDGFTDVVVLDMMPETNLRQKSMMVPFSNYDRFKLNLQMDYQPQYVRNTLQLNNGNGSFSEIGQLAGIYQTDWSWAPLFVDLDNDGLKDLLVTNGYGKDITDMDYVSYSQSLRSFGTEESKRKALLKEISEMTEIKISNYVFQNNGDLTFSNQTEAWGMNQASLSNGLAYADLDNDGDLDLVINNVNDPAFIYQNNTIETGKGTAKKLSFLKISLLGDSLNKQGIGSKIYLYHKRNNQQVLQYHEHYLTRGYKSTVDHTIHFGLDTVTQIDSLKIIWPDGKQQSLLNVTANQWLKLQYTDAKKPTTKRQEKTKPIFQEVSTVRNIHYRHQAEDFVDFNIQPLLPHKHSENGPGIAVGDVNGDNLEDFYVGGSPGHPGRLFIQEPNGSFKPTFLPGIQISDDMGALLFDADNDQDLDLYIVSGGSRFPKNAPEYLDRLYINDGDGNFTLDSLALPPISTSGSVVTAADFDRDGDLDLFIGGRLTPHEYPLPAKSYILENEDGHFKDVTSTICPEMENLGLVTTALWTDYDRDNRIDLLISGEWMPIMVFKQLTTNNGQIKFTNVTENAKLAGTTGWWNSLQAGDFDNDGDTDYIAGNLGLNSRYKASDHQPVSLYAKDYDNNGEIDPIIFYYKEVENYPAHTREQLISQVASFRGRFPKYKTLGQTTFHEFFSKEELQNAYVLQSKEFRTSYIENMGDGTFTIRHLPIEAQFSPVYGIISRDFNHDGNLDLLLAGNSYATEMYTGQYDAGCGNYLLGDGTGSFTSIPARESGFFADGNTKAVAELIGPKGDLFYLVTQNQDSLLAFSLAEKQENNLIIRLNPLAQHAVLETKSGKEYHQEFYHGSSYLSQTSRYLILDDDVTSVLIRNYDGSIQHVFNNHIVSESKDDPGMSL